MNSYRVNCAIVVPSVCGLIAIITGVAMQMFNATPFLTPLLTQVFAWWPQEIIISSSLIGLCIGVAVAAFMIAADIWRETNLRNYR